MEKEKRKKKKNKERKSSIFLYFHEIGVGSVTIAELVGSPAIGW